MTGQEILNNTFFAFWHTFGEYFLIILIFALMISIVMAFIYILTQR